ncbi:MAG: T9SS type A sorting domain-containing protein [Chitinophagales bacterium]|nr:T9SS type A sorting domain-containing protein [Chitinophagales bacterium]
MRHFWLVLGLCFSSLCTKAQFDLEKIVEEEMKSFQAKHCSDRAGAADFTDVVHQRLNLSVNPHVNYIAGSVTTTFIALDDIGTIRFDLSDSLTVDSVVYQGNTLAFTHSEDIVEIQFPSALSSGTVDSITVYYQGVPSQSGFGSFIQAYHDSVPIVWTLSEPYGGRDWWPCKQNLQDKIDSLDVVVTTPDSFSVASNGLLIAEVQNGNEKTFYWKHRYPIATYLVCIAVTNYAVYTDTVPVSSGKIIPVVNYVYPEKLEQAKLETPLIAGIMQLFDSLFGIYPFHMEKYGHAQFGWGGGMEHQTMTFMGNFGFELMAHELAHHWFGNMVTCAGWDDIWLNEGFATYLSGLCYENILPQYWMSFKETRIAGAVTQPNGSVWCDDTTNVSRIFSPYLSYSKGAMVLHMLRFVLGDEKFFSGIRNYLNDVNHAYSFATTTGLRQHLENVSGKNLQGFFNDWIYGKGFPSYTITWNQDFLRNTEVTVTQTQSNASVSYFEMPLPVVFRSAVKDTTIILNNSQNEQKFSFVLPFLADTLLFDPELWLLSANNTVLRESAYDFLFHIYPNPVRDELSLQFQTKKTTTAEIQIYNNAGQLVLLKTFVVQPGSQIEKFETATFAAGAYRIRVKADGYRYHASFLKSFN